MATPLTASRLVAVLRAEGLRVVEHRTWRTHNRNGKGPWGPVHGVMIHHTVTSGTAASVNLCYSGHAGLPGPLCHGVIAKDGTVYLVGNGRANHAGLGDGDVLRAVIREDTLLPPTNEDDTDGNARFYGFECINLGDGKDPWPAAQLEAIEKASAAICRAHGWSERSVIGHKEWTRRKIDPRGFAMSGMRGRIGQRLGGTSQQEEDDMPSAEEIYDAVWNPDRLPAPSSSSTRETNPHWRPGNLLRELYDRTHELKAAVRELTVQGAARDALLARLAEGGGLTAAEARSAAEAGAQAALDRLGHALTSEKI